MEHKKTDWAESVPLNPAPMYDSATLPKRHWSNSPRQQISFTSMSSTESGPDVLNASQDTVDAAPLRIQRMPLFDEEYIKHRQASVENLFSSKIPNQSSNARDSIPDGSSYYTQSTMDALRTSMTCDFKKINLDPDPYAYFEMHRNDGLPSFQVGHKISVDPSTYHIPHKDKNFSVEAKEPRGKYDQNLKLFGDEYNTRKGSDSPTPEKNTNNSSTRPNGVQEDGTSQQMGVTETDLSVNRPSRPFYNREPEQGEDFIINKRQPDVPISTPPRNTNTRPIEDIEEASGCCQNTCIKVTCTLFGWKYFFERFSLWDIVLTLASVAIFIFDVVTDLILSLKYYSKIEENEAYRFYFGLTLGLVIGPSIVIQIFSFVWVIIDFISRKKYKQSIDKETPFCKMMDVVKFFLIFIIHFFQLAVFFRYTRGLIYGMKSRYYEVKRRNNYRIHFDKMWRYEVHDISMLRLLESFLESAPQLVLQIYIMLMTKQVNLLAVISCIGSLLALSTMMVTIQRAIRNSNHEKQQLSIPASIVMFCWRLLTISSRVLAFALFLTIQPLAFLIFIILHWLAGTVWIAVRGTDFCPKKFAEYLFNAVCGIIYIFCFFNVHEDKDGRNSRSRCRMLIFYLVVFAENSVLSILWYFFRPGGDTRLLSWTELISSGILSSSNKPELTTPSLIPMKNASVIPTGYAMLLLLAVHMFYIMGLSFMLIYYTALHPRKRKQRICCFAAINNPSEESGTMIVSAPDDRFSPQNGEYSLVPHDERSSTPAGEVLMNTNDAPSSSRVDQGEKPIGVALRQRKKDSSLATGDNKSDSEVNWVVWSSTIFDRDERTRKLYNRQYSNEKIFDEQGISYPDEEPTDYSPRQTDRFKDVVTPTCDKRNVISSPLTNAHAESIHKTMDSNKCAQNSNAPQVPSIVIRPGSQTLKHNPAPRSATHQGFQSNTLISPRKNLHHPSPSSSLNPSPVKHAPSKKIPSSVENRDYSASMSCLMETKPLSYAARKRKALGQGMSQASSFMINKGEIVESMESSV